MSFHDSTLQQLLAGKILSLDPNRIPNSARVNPNGDINGNISIDESKNNNDNTNINNNSNLNINNTKTQNNHFHVSHKSITNIINDVHNNNFNNVFNPITFNDNNNKNCNNNQPKSNVVDKSERRQKIINKLHEKHVNFDKTEIEESDEDVIDKFSLGSITPDYLKNENILQLNEFINNSINENNINDNPILTSVINQSTTDNTKIEFCKLLKYGAATTNYIESIKR